MYHLHFAFTYLWIICLWLNTKTKKMISESARMASHRTIRNVLKYCAVSSTKTLLSSNPVRPDKDRVSHLSYTQRSSASGGQFLTYRLV